MPVATVVLWTMPSLTSRPIPQISRLTTHTLPHLPSSAKNPNTKAKLPLRASLMFQQTAKNNWLLLFKSNQSLLPSKPTNQSSNHTKVVSSQTLDAELTLTMVLLLLVMVLKMALNTSSSETHGEHHGVSKVISKLLAMTKFQKVSAVLPCKLHTQQYEFLK